MAKFRICGLARLIGKHIHTGYRQTTAGSSAVFVTEAVRAREQENRFGTEATKRRNEKRDSATKIGVVNAKERRVAPPGLY